MFKQYKLKNYKFILIALVVILNTIGVALVGSASPGDQKKQIIGMVSGIIIMLLVSYIDYNFILHFSWLIYLGAIGLLGLVIVAGEQSKGAQRWFKIGGFQFQPSELVKILMILFLRGKNNFPTGAVRIFYADRHSACPYSGTAQSFHDHRSGARFCGDAVCRGAQL